MAFGGVATITQINDHTVRITGVDAAANASGTIALFGGPAADITLPATFKVSPYAYQGSPVGLQDAIDVRINPITAGPLTNLQPSMAKTGTTVANFLITITNTNTTEATQTLEIVITFLPGHVGEPARLA